ncbi:MAG: oxidoreductase [Planctomycetes bacterium]|nr:oxidoreductase [Planctomycetota bacterium]
MIWRFVEDTSWSAVSIFTPLILAILAYALRDRGWRLIAWASVVLPPLAATALLVQVGRIGPVRYEIGGWGSPLGIDLQADALSALMVLMCAVVGSAVSLYAQSYFGPERAHFWPTWLMVWAALNAIFLAADLFNVYVTLELLTLGSVILIALSASTSALVAAFRYLMLALTGSLFYLLGVALLYGQCGTLDMALLGQRVDSSVPVQLAQALMILGLALKTALVPLHFWLPAAHSAAPAPVSAVLSGLIVKASFYVLVRLRLDAFDTVSTVAGDHVLGVLGAVAIVWGSLQAMRVKRLKLLVAYSTVAQIGYLFLWFPLAREAGAASLATSGVVLFALAHACAKAAVFLAVGAVMRVAGHDRISGLRGIGNRLPLATFAFGLAAVSLMGLPPSGGFAAKWLMLQAAITTGQWYWGIVIVLGGLLAAGYLFRFLSRALEADRGADLPPARGRSHAGLEVPAMLLAVAACVLGFLGVPLCDFCDNGMSHGGLGDAL